MSEMTKNIPKLKLPKILGLALITLILIGAGGYLFMSNQKMKNELLKLKDPKVAQQQSQAETTVTMEAVSKLIELPEGTPTLATVTDADKLKDQPFFKNAQNGDKVLIFTDAKKVIIYRPSTNKIIEVGGLNVTKDQNATPEQPITPKTN